MLVRIANIINGLSDFCGAILRWLSLLMVLVTCIVVLLRYGFGIGSIALQESVIYLHCMLFMLGAGYTLRRDDHVRVDVIYRRLSARGRAVVNLVGAGGLLIPVSIAIAWLSFDYVSQAWRIREGSQEAGGLAWVYLLKALIPLMSATLILQGLAQMLRALAELRGMAPADHDKSIPGVEL